MNWFSLQVLDEDGQPNLYIEKIPLAAYVTLCSVVVGDGNAP